MGRYLILLCAGFLLFCNGCRKDDDGEPPTVRILSPTAASTFALPATIPVRIAVTDDHIVENVVIDLVNADGISIAASVSASVNATSATIERDLIIADERLRSGTYTLAVRASDGSNDGRAFQGITLLETPLRLRSIFLAPSFSDAAVTITRIDSTGAQSNWATVLDFNGMAADSYGQQLMVAGYRIAPMQALPTSTVSLPWQFAPPAANEPEQFTALTVDPSDGRTYISTRDGYIRGFNGEGVQQFTAQCLTGHRCEAIVVMGNWIASWQRAIVGSAPIIVTYTPAGTVYETLPVEHDRVALFQRTGSSLLLFGNDPGLGLIEDLNITTAGTPIVRTFPEGEIRAVVRSDADNFIVALPSRLVRFNYPSNTITELAAGLTVNALSYEPATGVLLAGQGSDLLTIDLNSGFVLNSISTGVEIAHIQPLRNR